MANLTFTRKVVSVGGLLVVSLPKAWQRAHDVKKGGILTLEVLEDGSLRIRESVNKKEGAQVSELAAPIEEPLTAAVVTEAEEVVSHE